MASIRQVPTYPIIPSFLVILSGLTIQPAQAFNPDDFLNRPSPTGNGTVHDEIQCYALPYGAIGFASHILTYMTVICLSLGRNPLMPWLRLKNRRFNLGISVLGFLISFPLTVVTMVKCKNTWSFILIAVWKLVLSTTLTAMSIHAGRNIIDVPKPKTLRKKGRKKNKNGSRSPMSVPLTGYSHLEPPRNSYSGRNGSNSRVSSPYGSPNPYLSPTSPGYNAYSPQGHGSYFPGPPSGSLGQYSQLGHYQNESDDEDASPYTYQDSSDDEEEQLQSAQHKMIYKHIWQDPQYKSQFRKIWLWSPLYFFGAIVGFVGVMNIVRKNIATNHQLQIVTGVFGGIVLFIIVVVVVLFLCAFGKLTISLVMGAVVGVFVLTILFALYTDWALACLVGDVVGRPSRDNAVFYWCYFAAKRLPMLSF
ncbi:hypothetical protein V8F33_005485 [Rhypophila sp. PSN 637]